MTEACLSFSVYSYAELSKDQLYRIFELRQAVFVVEQACVYQDIDGKDFASYHIVGTDHNNTIVAYARLLPKGLTFSEYVSVGRVLSEKSVRASGAGRQLMQFCTHVLKNLWPDAPVKIQAQTYLLKFYSEFGFTAVGEEYLEDDIPHTDMVLLSSN